jgi:hypothetical protein
MKKAFTKDHIFTDIKSDIALVKRLASQKHERASYYAEHTKYLIEWFSSNDYISQDEKWSLDYDLTEALKID